MPKNRPIAAETPAARMIDAQEDCEDSGYLTAGLKLILLKGTRKNFFRNLFPRRRLGVHAKITLL